MAGQSSPERLVQGKTAISFWPMVHLLRQNGHLDNPRWPGVEKSLDDDRDGFSAARLGHVPPPPGLLWLGDGVVVRPTPTASSGISQVPIRLFLPDT